MLTRFRTANEFYHFTRFTFLTFNTSVKLNDVQIATCNYLTIQSQFIRNVNSKVRVNSGYSTL